MMAIDGNDDNLTALHVEHFEQKHNTFKSGTVAEFRVCVDMRQETRFLYSVSGLHCMCCVPRSVEYFE